MTIRIADSDGMPLIDDQNVRVTDNGNKIDVIPTIKELRKNG